MEVESTYLYKLNSVCLMSILDMKYISAFHRTVCVMFLESCLRGPCLNTYILKIFD